MEKGKSKRTWQFRYMARTKLSVFAIKTNVFHPSESLTEFLTKHLSQGLENESILVITSKVVSLAEGMLIKKGTITKAELVRREADIFLGEGGHGCLLTIKHGLMIPSAGIDESNSEDGSFILYPKDPFNSAKKIWQDLKQHYKLKKLGILISDSHTSPLRQGVTGIALSYWGFQGVRSHIGTPDIFGRELKMTKVNWADGLASMATLTMGEANECQPVAVITGAAVNFVDEIDPSEIQMPIKEDLYYPLFKK